MRDSNIVRLPDRFEHCHNGGGAYETYKSMESKFSIEFKKVELEYMVNLYMLTEFYIQQVQSKVEKLGLELTHVMAGEGVFFTYPYRMVEFPHTHPRSKEAVIEARKRMETL